MGRISALDGMRGVAICLVLAYHVLEFGQGWIGVDVFFVLSGYLITSILLAERNDRHFWKIFYTRRLARLTPAYVALLVGATAAGVVPWRLLWPYLLFFGGDIAAVVHLEAMRASALAITWSLAVEEHFYFLWPVQVRHFRPRTLVLLLSAILLLEPILRTVAVLDGAGWPATYYLTVFRLDGLAAGSLLAILMGAPRLRDRLRAATSICLWASLAGLALSWRWLDYRLDTAFCGSVAFSLLALFSVSLLSFVLLWPESWAARMFSWRPLVFLGRISYGLYLYHLLLMYLIVNTAQAHGYHHVTRLTPLILGCSVLAAWLSFRFYESVFLAWGRRRVGAYREEAAVLAMQPVGDSPQ